MHFLSVLSTSAYVLAECTALALCWQMGLPLGSCLLVGASSIPSAGGQHLLQHGLILPPVPTLCYWEA